MRSGRSHSSARSLEHERDEVARDKNARVPNRRDARVLSAKGCDDLAKTKIDSGGIKGGRDSKCDNLQKEWLFSPWVWNTS